MKYYCFVQARYSSKRLKGKVLKKFGKHTLLEILLKRLKKSKQINKIIVLTSTSRHDKKIVNEYLHQVEIVLNLLVGQCILHRYQSDPFQLS